MEAVADFERCVALLRGGDPGGATTALLGLRDNPQCVDIARAVLARSTDGDALFHALALFRDGALKPGTRGHRMNGTRWPGRR